MIKKSKPQIWRGNAEHPGVPYTMWSAQLRDAANIVEQLQQQRDVLLSALKCLLEEYRQEYSFHREPGVRCENVDAVLVAKQAIANVEAK